MRLFLGLFLASLGLGSCMLYEDQVGEFDWYQRYVGRVTQAVNRPRSRAGPDVLFVASDKNIVAALGADGQVMWKKALEEGDTLDHISVPDDAVGILIVSQKGASVRLIRPTDGSAVWESASAGPPLSGPCRPSSLISRVAVSDSRLRVVVLGGNCVLTEYSVMDGMVKWRRDLSELGSLADSESDSGQAAVSEYPTAIRLDSETFKVQALILAPQTLFVREFLLEHGTAKDTADVAIPGGAAASSLALLGGGRVAVYAAGSVLVGQGPEWALTAVDTTAVAGSIDALMGLSDSGSGVQVDAAVVSASGAHHIVQVSPQGALSVAASFPEGAIIAPVSSGVAPGVLMVGAALTSPTGALSLTAYVVTKDGSATKLSSFTHAAARLVPEHDLQREGAYPTLGLAGVFVVAGPAAAAARVLTVGVDGDSALIGPNGLVWHRPDHLASAAHPLFVDLPSPAEEAAGRYKRASWAEFMRLQVLRVKTMLGHASAPERSEERSLRERWSGKLQPTRDLHGMRRAAVVASSPARRVTALHSGDGRVLWTTHVGREGCEIVHVGPWMTSHDAAVSDRIAAFSVCAASAVIDVLSAASGKELDRIDLDFRPSRILPLENPIRKGGFDRHSFLAVNPSSSLAALVPSDLGAEVAADVTGKLHFWAVADAQARLLRGYRLGPQEKLPSVFPVEQAWESVLGGAGAVPGGEVVAYGARDPSDRTYSLLRHLPARQMALKYDNPNLGAAIVAAPGAAGEATVYLLDTVTGRVIHSQVQKGAAGPFRVAVGEHGAAAHFYLPEHGRHALLSIDLYEAEAPRVGAADLLASTAPDHRTPAGPGKASSYVPGASPEVFSRLFFAPHGANTLGYTRTGKGIANRQLLLGTPAGQVYAVDRRLVDPRRPSVDGEPRKLRSHQRKQKRAAERVARNRALTTDDENALPPYTEHLPLDGPSHLTHTRRVAGLRDVRLTPTGLESTSLMLALGTDMFFTRVQPSRQFDSLPEDFAYGPVVAALVMMAVAAVVLREFARRDEVSRQWK